MNEIRFEQAVFLQENRSEIEQVKEQWNRVTGKVISNTLVQMTNPGLIDRIIEVGEFVYNDDITPTSLNLIKRTLEEAQSYVRETNLYAVKTLSGNWQGLLPEQYGNLQEIPENFIVVIQKAVPLYRNHSINKHRR